MQTRQAVALVIVVAIIALALGVSLGYGLSASRTTTSTLTTTLTPPQNVSYSTEISPTTVATTQLATVTRTQTITSLTSNMSLAYLPIGTQVTMSENSSIEVFVRYYFYDSNRTVTISPSNNSLVFIWGGNYSADISTTNPNFTIREISPVTPLTIGGADNESEGTIVAYQIHSTSNSNGSYALGVYQLFPEYCNIEFPLIVGNGSPDYTSKIIGGCIEYIGNDPSVIGDQLLAQVLAIDS